MVAGERVARACGPGVLLQEPTDYIKVSGLGWVEQPWNSSRFIIILSTSPPKTHRKRSKNDQKTMRNIKHPPKSPIEDHENSRNIGRKAHRRRGETPKGLRHHWLRGLPPLLFRRDCRGLRRPHLRARLAAGVTPEALRGALVKPPQGLGLRSPKVSKRLETSRVELRKMSPMAFGRVFLRHFKVKLT